MIPEHNKLYEACISNSAVNARLELTRIDDIKIDEGFALKMACSAGSVDVVRLLVEHGDDVTINDNQPIIWAARNGHHIVVEYLVSMGADPTAQGYRALITAAAGGHTGAVKYLSQYGFTTEALNEAASAAVRNDNTAAVSFLVGLGADNKFRAYAASIEDRLRSYSHETC